LQQVFPETGHVAAVSITRDHGKLFTASEIGRKGFQLRAWEVATGKKAMTPVEQIRGRVSSFKFNRDATLLAVGYFNGAVEVIQLSRPYDSKLRIPPLGGPVTVMEFSPDSSHLLAAHFADSSPETFGPDIHSIRGPSQVRLFDLPDGRPVLQAPLKHPRAIWAAAFSADGTMFVTESGEWSDTQTQGQVHFWNLKGAEIRKPLLHPGSALGLALSPDNTKLLTGHWDFKARLWDLSQTNTNALTAEFPCNSPARFVAFSARRPDMIFIASFGGTAQLWDIATRSPISPPLWHHDLVRCSSFSPEGSWILL
jgi:WD40 repeat protein